ncbi:MAG TPA: DUF4261 domain-containing protein [Anaeromyxobacteraceae bacterium]
MELFTQCACVLLDQAPAIDDVELALDGWALTGRQQPAPDEDGWVACGPGVVVELRGGGSVIVDVVDRPWPDDLQAASGGSALGAAWRAGMLGPTSMPGALARAREQSWAWAEGAAAAERHRAFVRLRTVVELPQDARQLPKSHDPVYELTTLTEMAGALLRLRGATALFLPGGEALRSLEQVEGVLRLKTGVGPPPVDLWVNLRALSLGQVGDARWMLLDTVGMAQLRLPDHEALFVEAQEEADAVAALLRNVCLHLVAGRGIADGSTADDGRGRRWRASAATGALLPHRTVLRWLPEESPKPNAAMQERLRPR